MNYYKKLLCILTLISFSAAAQTDQKSLLWEISGNGLSKPSYLYGTMHTANEKFFNLSDSVFIALESSENFAAEINMDSLALVSSKILEIALHSDKSILNLLNEEELAMLNLRLKKDYGIDLNLFPVKHPAFIAVMLEKDLFSGNMPFAIDEYLYRIAKSRNKNITGLESIDDQITLLTEIPDEDIKKSILNTLKGNTEEAEYIKNLYEAYLSEDLDKINEIVISSMNEMPDMETMFLVDRNLKMAEKIDSLIKENSVFIGVGAAHLPGEEGLIKLLQDKGYSLRPVQMLRTGMADKYKKEMVNSSGSK